eukprot:CAMPEP_0202098748 /NCGR_PEP_ID=MMETSP0965-20130614/2037_1 /ASSEMBLY_ACC=CAM_ASM_000507 /TAXON_ID=4773 /ORGANISM="Schizochytrium aggregatum, Strain ATCC28209" /LENGTH=354 /DNA_ID=CAMNT_0048667239 /DNA_START=138 /DNA_END=1202 /DNA_ORIENTATION=+
MAAKVCMAAAAALAALAGAAQGQGASETVTVAVTIPVTVPLEVPAGKSFSEAAAEFAQRNGLTSETVPVLEKALTARWEEMSKDNLRRNQCFQWQLDHQVFPLKDWGTLPEAARIQWLQLECDSVVPAEPPAALVTLEVQVGDTKLYLRAFEGDTIRQSVERFCTAHGIDMSLYGQELITAVADRFAATQAQQQQQQQQQQETERQLLFSLPVDIDGRLVRLRVHQGDDLDEIVRNFCAEFNLDLAEVGEPIRKAIIDTTEKLQEQLQDELRQQYAEQQAALKQAVETPEEPKLLLDIPINVDGREFALKLYDGDFVDTKINSFCEQHGLDKAVHGPLLLRHVAERTQALQAQQ